MPMSAVSVLTGSASCFEQRSQPSSIAAPSSIEAGMSTRWSALAKSIRAKCGTASPTKPIGPQKAVTVPDSNVVARKINVRVRPTFSPIVRA